jgi:hypothetical protein
VGIGFRLALRAEAEEIQAVTQDAEAGCAADILGQLIQCGQVGITRIIISRR